MLQTPLVLKNHGKFNFEIAGIHIIKSEVLIDLDFKISIGEKNIFVTLKIGKNLILDYEI